MNVKNKITVFLLSAFLLTGSAVLLVACSSNGYKDPELGINDPLEDVNRATLKVNEAADKVVLEPIAKGYRYVTPEPLRVTVRNFLRNLRSPVVIGNELLQGDFEGAGNATARLIINTLAGFGGILDLAEMGGIEHEPEDFGQTLAKWGVGDGMYVMLPLLGPSTVRDATGTLVDSYADPVRIYLFNVDEEHLHYTRVGAEVVSKREELIEVIDDLRRNSFDYYAAIRSAYYQHRRALINDQAAEATADIPDYDDF
jgi:phospholipid-binding lipoprotein MlaA